MVIETAASGLLGIVNGLDSNRLAVKAETNGVGPVISINPKTFAQTCSLYINGGPDSVRLPSGINRYARIRYSGEVKGGTIYHVDIEQYVKQLGDREQLPAEPKLNKWYSLPEDLNVLELRNTRLHE